MKLKELTATTKQLAEHFGVSEKYISQLVLDHGMPKISHNTFNFWECTRWYRLYREKIKDEENKRRLEENTRSRLDRVQAELKELELEEKKQNLISAVVVEESKRNDAIIYSRSLDALDSKLPPLLLGLKTLEEISKTIRKETNSIRRQVASLPADIRAEEVTFNVSG